MAVPLRRRSVSACLAAALACCACLAQAQAPAAPSTSTLAIRAQALRAQLGPPTQSLSENRDDFLRRQLLASLERRQDMVLAIRDVQRLSAAPGGQRVAPPGSLLALDDLRREIQRLDAELASGDRRRGLLEQERGALASQLGDKVAAHRALVDAGAEPDAIAMAKLESELTESATAETDLMLRLVNVQQAFAKSQRDAIASALSASRAREVTVTARDAAQIDLRLRTRGDALRGEMAAAAVARERAREELAQSRLDTAPLRLSAMKERIANADMQMELAREALTNLSTEQIAWQTAMRIYRERDTRAIVEARRYGPGLLDRLRRRGEFLGALSDQTLARSGALSTEITQDPASAMEVKE